jgi:regulator of sirC expression with transglutaminase-like and TPR domain
MFQPIPDLDYFRLLISDDRSFPLLEAAASIGVIAYPAFDLQGTLAAIDGLARRMAEQCRGVSNETARLQKALRFFYDTLGFAGNAQDYYEPDNSYLHRVLETRRGIPITLAVLFAELARPSGLDVEGVAFPGHFLIRANLHGGGLIVIDPFTGLGLDSDELDRRAAPHGVPAGRLLRPASARHILIRMLNNLHLVYAQQGRGDLLAQVGERLRLLQTDGSAR